MNTKTMTLAMIISILAMPFLAQGQTPTVVVNPVAIAAGDADSPAGNDLTDMFLASLLRTKAFKAIDTRTDRQAARDFYLSSRCTCWWPTYSSSRSCCQVYAPPHCFTCSSALSHYH